MQKLKSILNHPEVKSVLTTFFASFILSVAISVKALDNPGIAMLETGVIWGILTAGVRSALKLAIEKTLSILATKAE
jgi:hypothetical protein